MSPAPAAMVTGPVSPHFSESALRKWIRQHAIDEVIAQSEHTPAWLVVRQRVLGALVRNTWRQEQGTALLTRRAVLERVRARDLKGALDAAKASGSAEIVSILERLSAAAEKVRTKSKLHGGGGIEAGVA